LYHEADESNDQDDEFLQLNFSQLIYLVYINLFTVVTHTQPKPTPAQRPPETNRNAFPKEKKQTKKEQQEKCA
jgi:hypothetical protein